MSVCTENIDIKYYYELFLGMVGNMCFKRKKKYLQHLSVYLSSYYFELNIALLWMVVHIYIFFSKEEQKQNISSIYITLWDLKILLPDVLASWNTTIRYNLPVGNGTVK